MHVRILYHVSTLLLQVLDDPSHFTLCMVYDSGRKEKCDKDYPLLARLRAGPDEEVAKLYIVESDSEVGMNVSAEVSKRSGENPAIIGCTVEPLYGKYYWDPAVCPV